jgi:hypothetical protein
MGDWMDAQSLIACWELGRRRHPLDRALLLYAAGEPDADPDSLADRTLGERNAALLRLRQKLFGDALKSCVECPQCREQLEFTLSGRALLGSAPVPDCTHAQLGELRVRMPTSRDLASFAGETDEARASDMLLKRLVDADAAHGAITGDELSAALEAADPRMDVSLDLSCPACTHSWAAPFDVPAFLWEEIDVRARRLLDEVHALARAYGWSEGAILALSNARRRAYLERVLA